ncbi:MAG: class I SAM-dependent rRNA methyltransferase [Gemmatimonadetes bacterium]|nr:class I SAM-dependent rRNA methyltransferase [Gemmatimonadota bacterium]
MPSPTAIVSSRGAKRLAAGHPWVFRSDLASAPDAPPGVVRVADARGHALGWAWWSPASEIVLRRVTRDANATIDGAWWHGRLRRAAERRAPLGAVTNACRIVHGEGDGLPALVVDRYDEWLVVQLLSAAVEAQRALIIDALRELFAPAGILARNDAPVRAREGLARDVELLDGAVPEAVEVNEHGVRYLAAPWTGQKTGAFLDQRENRVMLGALARGRALDVFSYHGSFALHLARGAASVTAVDASAQALERAQANAARNGIGTLSCVEADAFDYLRDAAARGEQFDVIALDPPALAKNRGSVAGALRGYKELNLRAMRLLAPGGLLFTASCSYHVTKPMFLDVVREAAADSHRPMILRGMTGQPLDHPEVVTIPESGYLKGVLLENGDG